MMNSHKTAIIRRIVDELLLLLREETIRAEIDERVQLALANHSALPADGSAHANFHASLAACVKHLYAHGLRYPKHLTTDEALAEAILLLDHHPAAQSFGGYEGALVAARLEGDAGLRGAFDFLSEALVHRERSNYTRWIITTRLGGRSFFYRRLMASELLRRYGRWIRPQATPPDPAWLADDLTALLSACLAADEEVRRCVGESILYRP